MDFNETHIFYSQVWTISKEDRDDWLMILGEGDTEGLLIEDEESYVEHSFELNGFEIREIKVSRVDQDGFFELCNIYNTLR